MVGESKMSQFTFYANKPTENYHKMDMGLFLSIIFIWGLGIVTLFVCTQNYALKVSTSPFYFVQRQLLTSLVGFVFFMFFLLTDMSKLRKLLSIIVLATFVLCLLTFVKPLSIEKNGARRWLKMPFNFSFQPSELVKFSIVLFLANYFDKQQNLSDYEEKTVLPCVIGMLFFVVIVFAQKDFSTGLFIFLISILMFFVTGSKLMWLIPFAFVAIPAVFLMISLEPYRLERIIGYLRPDEFASNVNYQSLASKRAISAGGFWGSGIGAGLTKTYNIPEVQADYIFAGWTEAMGLLGVVVYFVVLIFFAFKGYQTAFKSPDRFSAYACFGCVSSIFIQSLVNIMVVGGLLPSTGIPLPFFSLGGSSIIVTLAMCGFILNVSRGEISITEKEEFQTVDIDSISSL